MRFVVSLGDLGQDDLATAGGKAANLGELVRAGFPVPDGFVVTTDAYATVIQPLDLNIPERIAAGEGASVRADIETAPMPADLRTEIANAYAALGTGPVAVRSSATAEDLPGAAFAGQQDTYLNVVGEAAVIDAVQRCWGSLWTERAIAYRSRIKIDSADVRIAVVVQRMINAEVAGVMFTADPVSGDRETIVVDASSGLGEAVVSGLVTPDHYALDGRGLIRDYRPGRREVIVSSVPGGGVAHQPGEPADIERLPDTVLADLARLGIEVAEALRAPAGHRMGLRGGAGVAAAGASDDRAAATTDRAERCATSARLSPARLCSSAPVPDRYEHLGALWSGRPDGRGHREVRVSGRV